MERCVLDRRGLVHRMRSHLVAASWIAPGFWIRIFIRNGPVARDGMFTASAVMKTSCHSRFLWLASRVLLGVIRV